jgi:hypothetical protein
MSNLRMLATAYAGALALLFGGAQWAAGDPTLALYRCSPYPWQTPRNRELSWFSV